MDVQCEGGEWRIEDRFSEFWLVLKCQLWLAGVSPYLVIEMNLR
jgi:hypothetical protein